MTRLTFDSPITAVVGPNGSGKSNIADALLWVMGEQSTKTLRGGKMVDVIFGGTVRRPQQNFAEVSLILDNTDGNLNIDTTEVMLTRRYYRSGESEYFINRKNAKLKEINELLMDTGLGREGYSVIGQGKISEIVMAKNKDRRDIFEEAAGISRYRYKKEEAERELRGTEENLIRIGDVIDVLESQVGPLKEQAEVAKKYNSLIDELKGVQIALWLKEIENIDASTEKIKNDIQDAQREVDTAEVEYNDVLQQSESLAEMTKESDIEAEKIRSQITLTESEINEVDTAIAVCKSQLEQNTSQIETINISLKNDEQQHDGVGSEISDSEKRLGDIDAQRIAKDNEMKKLGSELEEAVNTSDRAEREQRELISKEQSLQEKLSEKKMRFSALAAGAQELYDSEGSYKQKLADAKADLKNREDEHKRCQALLKKAKEDATELENIINGFKLKLENRTKKASASGEEFERLSYELKEMQARAAFLDGLAKEYEGYYKPVRLIMQEHSRGTLKNIHGTVAELMKTEDAYTVAIETALGNTLQNIIVDTEEDSKAVTSLLKQRKAGTVTLQPISSVKGTALNSGDFANNAGYLGLAVDFVDFDKKYSGIYNYLLGRILICDNIDNAIRMARRLGHRYRIVTLDGQVMNAGGSMTVGSARTGAGSGMLSRANELEQLTRRIGACTEKLSKAEREHAQRTREMNEARYEFETTEEQLRTAAQKVEIHEIEKQHCEQNLANANILVNTLTDEIETFTGRIKQNTIDTDELKAQIDSLGKELAAVGEEITKAISGNDFITKERERITAARSRLEAELAALDAEKGAVEKALANLRGLLGEMSGSRQAQLDNIEKLEADNEKIRSRIVGEEEKASQLKLKRDKQKESLNAITSGKLEVEEKRNKINAAIKQKSNDVILKQQAKSRLDTKLETVLGEEKAILDKLMETWGLGPTAAKNYAAQIESVASARKRVSAITREVDDLGPINPLAISQYEQASEHYEYMTSQRDDVLGAKAKLLGIIDDYTAKMKSIFTREFEIINESFKRTFRTLFGGGRAELILEDPEDVLNCGIEIEVQPPGKKLLTMSLLSGGEKTFVAIAIYFAILEVRAPPFVVMDEIEAALDEANVVKFADYMRYMSDRSQMIVITHRRGTMEEADVLYGVTMQELGVSSIMHVDLNEAEKHAGSKVSA